jgi:hypothetical protein
LYELSVGYLNKTQIQQGRFIDGVFCDEWQITIDN